MSSLQNTGTQLTEPIRTCILTSIVSMAISATLAMDWFQSSDKTSITLADSTYPFKDGDSKMLICLKSVSRPNICEFSAHRTLVWSTLFIKLNAQLISPHLKDICALAQDLQVWLRPTGYQINSLFTHNIHVCLLDVTSLSLLHNSVHCCLN